MTQSPRPPTVDAHHHLWDPARLRYPFLEAPGHEPIRRMFGLAQLAATVTDHGVAQTVVVQAAADIAETEWLLALAAGEPLIGGVVGWIDCDATDPAAELERLSSHPNGEQLLGIRLMAQDHPDPGWLSRPEVWRAAQAVGAAGLVCELLIRPPQAAAARALVTGLPEVSFVVDHAGKPEIAAGMLEPWRTTIRDLATVPSVACKVSGLITEAHWSAWTTAQIAPFVDVVAGAFGSDRLLFGSDWPVCLLAGTYADVVRVADETLGGLPADKIFGGNARRIYGLTPGSSRRPSSSDRAS